MKALDLNELMNWKPPFQKYVIDKGLLLPQTKLILFGKYETWKSMLTIHTAFCIATGKDWFGFATSKSPVYILQIEVPQAELQKRVIKYVQGNSITSQDIFFASEHYFKLDRGYGYAELEKELSRTQAQILILDPLYKLVSGRMTDEYDMRIFMDKMDELIHKFKLSLIMVHHDRKHQIINGELVSFGAEDMFGTSIFIDWCDTSIKTTLGSIDGDVTLSFEKARHAEDELKPIQIHINRSNLTFHRKV